MIYKGWIPEAEKRNNWQDLRQFLWESHQTWRLNQADPQWLGSTKGLAISVDDGDGFYSEPQWSRFSRLSFRKAKTYHLVMTNIAMENPPISKNGKPSISMGHLYHGYVSHNQRVNGWKFLRGIVQLGGTQDVPMGGDESFADDVGGCFDSHWHFRCTGPGLGIPGSVFWIWRILIWMREKKVRWFQVLEWRFKCFMSYIYIYMLSIPSHFHSIKGH